MVKIMKDLSAEDLLSLRKTCKDLKIDYHEAILQGVLRRNLSLDQDIIISWLTFSYQKLSPLQRMRDMGRVLAPLLKPRYSSNAANSMGFHKNVTRYTIEECCSANKGA